MRGIARGQRAAAQLNGTLCRALEVLCAVHSIQSLVDLGCGLGQYQRALARNLFTCHGYDGNPHTSWLTQGRCGMADLSVPLNLGRRYDMVLSLEVGEHIPPAFEDVYLGNVDRHAGRWVVLSWAVPGQGGLGHVNERPNAYIEERMHARGWVLSKQSTENLRMKATLPWFRNTVMAFRRKTHSDQ